ncbi:MAG: hypothetical protein GKR77_00350 [Legionellales bacterium]|nr:hypothetical protein [Legionellales bacterium]
MGIDKSSKLKDKYLCASLIMNNATKTIALLTVITYVSISMLGCSNVSGSDTGTVLGAAGGAGLGYLAGDGVGSIIGAGVGAYAGKKIGEKSDRKKDNQP